MAAIRNINSIKWEHRTTDELLTLERVKRHLAKEYITLNRLTEKEEEE